jgi:hypothetical protein
MRLARIEAPRPSDPIDLEQRLGQLRQLNRAGQIQLLADLRAVTKLMGAEKASPAFVAIMSQGPGFHEESERRLAAAPDHWRGASG